MGLRMSRHNIKRIVAMYYGGRCMRYIATVIGCSRVTVHNVLVRQKVPLRQCSQNRRRDDPSPEEIERAAAEIRSTWGELEEQERRDRIPYDAPASSGRLKPL